MKNARRTERGHSTAIGRFLGWGDGPTGGAGPRPGIRRGGLFCWGDGPDLSRLFGVDGDMFRHPRRVGERSDWRTALPTDDGVCALRRDGALFCQGSSGLDGFDTMNQIGLSTGWSTIDAGSLTTAG